MSATDTDESGSSLCAGCGMCCDGTFLDRGVILPDKETMPLSFYKNEYAEYDGQLCFKIPCPHYEGQGCPIYESRFAVCRLYSCNLLQKLDKGEISLAEGKQTVAAAKALVAAVKASDPEGGVKRERMRLRLDLQARLPEADETERKAIGKRILNMAMLDRFIETHFHSPKVKDDASGGANEKPIKSGRKRSQKAQPQAPE